MLQCPDPRVTEQFRKYIAPIPELLKKLETSPPVTDAIMDILHGGFDLSDRLPTVLFLWLTAYGMHKPRSGGSILCLADGLISGRLFGKPTTNELEARKLLGDGLQQLSTNYPWFAGICGLSATTYYTHHLGL